MRIEITLVLISLGVLVTLALYMLGLRHRFRRPKTKDWPPNSEPCDTVLPDTLTQSREAVAVQHECGIQSVQVEPKKTIAVAASSPSYQSPEAETSEPRSVMMKDIYVEGRPVQGGEHSPSLDLVVRRQL